MSYALDFAPDAFSQWRELDVALQELVLDELDRLADNPPSGANEDLVRDFIYHGQNVDHYVFLRVVLDRGRGKVVLTGVAHLPRPRIG